MSYLSGLEEELNKKLFCEPAIDDGSNDDASKFEENKTELVNKQSSKFDEIKQNSRPSILESCLFQCNEKTKNCFYFENLTDDEFFSVSGANDQFVSFYKSITKSGVGSVILGGIYLAYRQKMPNNVARITLDETIMDKYKQITKNAHTTNCKIYLKVKSCYGRFNSFNQYSQSLKLASNYGLDPSNKQRLLIRISDNKCNEIVNDLARTVMLSNIAGFDGIMIDATFDNIMGELSSQEFNKRVFGYFSDTNDFLKKALKNIDAKNNRIILKLSVLSLFSYEKENANLCKISRNFDENKLFENIKEYISLGVDAFEFEFGTPNNEFFKHFNSFEGDLLFKGFYSKLRKKFEEENILNKFGEPVDFFYHDKFTELKEVEKMIKTNIVQFVDITRNLLTDNNYLKNIINNKIALNCINCSNCDKKAQFNHKIECLINPSLNDKIKFCSENKNKNVAVIGSGISGLICAITLAERGFNVHLFEQKDELNPNGKATCIYGFDKTLLNYYNQIESRINELASNKMIVIHLNTKFDYIKENEREFYSIIVATGYKTKFLSISGAVLPHVQNIYDVLKKESAFKNKKNIVIYAKSLLSLKLALYLSSQQKVTVIIKSLDSFKNEKNANLFYFFWNLYKNNANIHFLSRITKINEDNLDLIINKNFNPKSINTLLKLMSNEKISSNQVQINIDCDYLIYEPDLMPNNSLYASVVKQNYPGEVYLIGNALENSDLEGTIKSGYFVGKNL